ncbi:MAPEG family protein [Colwellia psychrerythraea]|uniref:Membrane-associated protein in eicosanoid and glutathione metabolism (MAPEG) n=1 Tax=Colwellia psychrerythraea TaxID=28229 RepID=A0A099KAQ2_COLPS|nr:MAPEG family protein [Colwellia psychrerythraea]KGJ87431.1 membrane-associated protein in eicosanoid and glutathione metabolism (MAPEG) [Colwellia psychrerythraea]
MDNIFWFAVLVSINSLLLLALAMNVSRLRVRYKVSLGDGGNKILMAAIRAHANAVEQLPTYAIVVLALTLLETSAITLAILVVGFTFSRFIHAYGMLYRTFLARRIGAGFTYIFQIVAAIVIGVSLLT